MPFYTHPTSFHYTPPASSERKEDDEFSNVGSAYSGISDPSLTVIIIVCTCVLVCMYICMYMCLWPVFSGLFMYMFECVFALSQCIYSNCDLKLYNVYTFLGFEGLNTENWFTDSKRFSEYRYLYSAHLHRGC